MNSAHASGAATRTFTVIAGISGCMAVVLGAFGAHALKESLSPDMLATFETGVRYQMFHVVGILAVAWLGSHTPAAQKFARFAGWCFVAGTIFFSMSLYLLALTGERWLGAITPIGGVLFMAGWILLALSAWKNA